MAIQNRPDKIQLGAQEVKELYKRLGASNELTLDLKTAEAAVAQEKVEGSSTESIPASLI